MWKTCSNNRQKRHTFLFYMRKSTKEAQVASTIYRESKLCVKLPFSSHNSINSCPSNDKELENNVHCHVSVYHIAVICTYFDVHSKFHSRIAFLFHPINSQRKTQAVCTFFSLNYYSRAGLKQFSIVYPLQAIVLEDTYEWATRSS